MSRLIFMESKLLNNLTFILTLNGRESFTERWLYYMREAEFFNPIIIADGDKNSKIKKILTHNKFGNLNINYLEFNDQKVSDYYYKVQQTLKKVQTKYIMMCDNDDFVLKSGVLDVLNFLNKNKNYLSVGSNIANFYINKKKEILYGNNFYIDSFYKTYRQDESEKNLKKKIVEIFTNFQPNFYNIFDLNAYKIIIDELKECNYSDMFIPEFYIQLRTLTLGRQMKLTTSVQLLRQLGTSQTNAEHFSKRFIRTDIPLDIRKLAKSLSFHIAKKDTKYNQQNIEKKILDSFSNFLTVMFSRYYAKYRFKKLYKIKLIFYYLMTSILKFFNNFFIYIYLKKNVKKYSLYQKEISNVVNFLKKN